MALDFAAGCLGGCAGVIVGHPLDTIKVHLQTQNATNPMYKGTIDCFRTLVARDGIRGLYRGISSPLAGIAAINAVIFGVYGNVQRKMSDPDALRSHFYAGAIAGFAQSFLTSPMELVKTRIQVAGTGSPLRCFIELAKKEGFKGVFKGYGITVCREIPAFSSYFLTYEYLTRNESNLPTSTPMMLFAGGFAGTVSWVLTYPIDVIKSRLQVDGMSGTAKYSGAFDCFKKSVQIEGYSCLSRGLMSTVLRAFPTNAACFAVVTWTFRLCSPDVETTSVVHHEHVKEPRVWEGFKLAVQNFKDPDTVTA